MSKNIEQIYIENPTTIPLDSDLIYAGKSPYNAADDSAELYSTFNAGIVARNSSRLSVIGATTEALVGAYNNGTAGIGATFTFTATGVQSIDNNSIVLSLGVRVLVKNQAGAIENGIYIVTTAGDIGVNCVLTRVSDFDNSQPGNANEGVYVVVVGGTENGGTCWIANLAPSSPNGYVIGTDPITWGAVGGIRTLTGDDGIATQSGGNIDVLTGAPGGCGKTIKFSASGDSVVFEVTDNRGNIYLGALTGNPGSTTDLFNQIFGNRSFDNLGFNGNRNTSLGDSCGTEYIGSESNNVLIRNRGVAGDNNKLRLGTTGNGDGEQNECILGAVRGVSVATLAVLGYDPTTEVVGETNLVAGPGIQLSAGANEIAIESTAGNFSHIINIADNGNDSTGTGSFSSPMATIAGANTKVISPTETNTYLILDNRTGLVNENVELKPFTMCRGNQSLRFTGNIALNLTAFAAVTTRTFTGFGNYLSIGDGGASVLNLDFSTLDTATEASLYLTDVPKAIFASTSKIIGLTRLIQIFQDNFNTYVTDYTGSEYSDIEFEGAYTYYANSSATQVSKITHALSSSIDGPAFYFTNTIGIAGKETDSDQITVDLTGAGIVNSVLISIKSGFSQPSFKVLNEVTATSIFDLYYNIGCSWSITTTGDSTANYPTPNDYSALLGCAYTPINYTATPFIEEGKPIPVYILDAHLHGIDLKLGNLGPTAYPLNAINGWNIAAIGNTEFDITPGGGVSSDNSAYAETSSNITVNLSFAGAGGLDTGTFDPNEEYGCYIIWEAANPSNTAGIGSLNSGLNTMPAVMPAPYDRARWVGSVSSDSFPLLIPYTQEGLGNDRTCMYATPVSVLSGGTQVSTPLAVSCIGAVPRYATSLTSLQVVWNGGTDVSNSLNIYSGNFVTPQLKYVPAISNVIFNAVQFTTAPVTLDSSRNFYYALGVGTGGAAVDLAVCGFKISV